MWSRLPASPQHRFSGVCCPPHTPHTTQSHLPFTPQDGCHPRHWQQSGLSRGTEAMTVGTASAGQRARQRPRLDAGKPPCYPSADPRHMPALWFIDLRGSSFCSGLNFPSVLSCSSHVRLFATPWTVAHWDPLSMGFSRQEYWNGLPFPSPGDLPDSEMETVSLFFFCLFYCIGM